jgi:hypothetical protein
VSVDRGTIAVADSYPDLLKLALDISEPEMTHAHPELKRTLSSMILRGYITRLASEYLFFSSQTTIPKDLQDKLFPLVSACEELNSEDVACLTNPRQIEEDIAMLKSIRNNAIYGRPCTIGDFRYDAPVQTMQERLEACGQRLGFRLDASLDKCTGAMLRKRR